MPMAPTPFQNVLVLTGPTASGKTELGVELAQRLNAEIISMDSMAVYRQLDIATAKPTPAQRAGVTHHLIDVLDPWESASVWWWLDQAKRCVQKIEERGKQALFVGGTPLYLKAMLRGLFDGPSGDEAIRNRLSALAPEELYRRLLEVDPPSAARIHANDVRRMVRALEVHELTGKPLSEWQTQWSQPASFGLPESMQVLWLDQPREQLYQRINTRVVEMMHGGLLDEARRLRSMSQPLSPEAGKALGYHDVFEVLDGTITREEAIVRIQTRTRSFAKRQIAWFRHLPECRPVTMELTRALWKPRMKG
jgi:tRNA dimethylallyltransferase